MNARSLISFEHIMRRVIQREVAIERNPRHLDCSGLDEVTGGPVTASGTARTSRRGRGTRRRSGSSRASSRRIPTAWLGGRGRAERQGEEGQRHGQEEKGRGRRGQRLRRGVMTVLPPAATGWAPVGTSGRRRRFSPVAHGRSAQEAGEGATTPFRFLCRACRRSTSGPRGRRSRGGRDVRAARASSSGRRDPQ